jgi:mRNA interferase MazF
MGMVVRQYDVWLVILDPTTGAEMKKTRPCLILSPNEMNQSLRTVIIAPMTTHGIDYPSRVPCRFQGRSGQIVLDQIRTVDRGRFVRRLGRLNTRISRQVAETLTDILG